MAAKSPDPSMCGGIRHIAGMLGNSFPGFIDQPGLR